MPSLRFASAAIALALATRGAAQATQDCSGDNVCQSFGVDFVSDGTYFQNSLSTDPFTLVQEFTGCQNDTANNVLIDPSGNEYECTDTLLTPNDTPETVTCPLEKDQLTSGEWSLIIISNNGDACPIAYQRDFSLTVGPQQTVTATPVVTVNTAVTPLVTATVTSISVIKSTAKTSTVTAALLNLQPTVTVTPAAATSTVTQPALTLTSTVKVAKVVATSTVVATASCSLPASRRQDPDPIASVVPSILGSSVSTIFSQLGINLKKAREVVPVPKARSASTEFKRALIERRAVEPDVKAAYIIERRERLALKKRAPDVPTVTVTETTAFSTTTVTTATAAASTIFSSVVTTSTSYTTPLTTITKLLAVGIATTTAPQQTKTTTVQVAGKVIVTTQTTSATLTITSTTTPAALVASCSSAGGSLPTS